MADRYLGTSWIGIQTWGFQLWIKPISVTWAGVHLRILPLQPVNTAPPFKQWKHSDIPSNFLFPSSSVRLRLALQGYSGPAACLELDQSIFTISRRGARTYDTLDASLRLDADKRIRDHDDVCGAVENGQRSECWSVAAEIQGIWIAAAFSDTGSNRIPGT